MGKVWCDVYPKQTRFYFRAFYICANFGENQSRNTSVREHADGHTDRRKLVLWSVPCYILYTAMGQIVIQEGKYTRPHVGLALLYVATLYVVYHHFTAESVCERRLKIGQHLAKLWVEVRMRPLLDCMTGSYRRRRVQDAKQAGRPVLRQPSALRNVDDLVVAGSQVDRQDMENGERQPSVHYLHWRRQRTQRRR